MRDSIYNDFHSIFSWDVDKLSQAENFPEFPETCFFLTFT